VSSLLCDLFFYSLFSNSPCSASLRSYLASSFFASPLLRPAPIYSASLSASSSSFCFSSSCSSCFYFSFSAIYFFSFCSSTSCSPLYAPPCFYFSSFCSFSFAPAPAASAYSLILILLVLPVQFYSPLSAPSLSTSSFCYSTIYAFSNLKHYLIAPPLLLLLLLPLLLFSSSISSSPLSAFLLSPPSLSALPCLRLFFLLPLLLFLHFLLSFFQFKLYPGILVSTCLLLISSVPTLSTLLRSALEPKLEIFGSGVYTQIGPVWVGAKL
jgi:hypothetical protein